MHLDPAVGMTIMEVRASGYPIAAEVPCAPPDDTRAGMAAAVGLAISGMADPMQAWGSGWLLVLGDRGEQLAAAVVASHLGLPIAHLHGGERTFGAVDDTVRDLISRVAHLHLVATDDSARRLEQLGEDRWRIHVVGAPGLDGLTEQAAPPSPELRARLGLPAAGPFLLVLQHPETRAERAPADDMDATLEAVSRIGLPAVGILPNTDAGGEAMRAQLAKGGLHTVASLPRADYAAVLGAAAALVGNSSSGIIEAPLLATPAVNVGDRQAGRARGDNVIEVVPEVAAIEAGIRRALDPTFRAGLSRTSPYGDGHASERIASVLASTDVDERLFAKGPG
jgi:UDP-hydrolysing UDP-N-acetyl-D-glucosamine 2-epimerase